jgi:hypothetical protein
MLPYLELTFYLSLISWAVVFAIGNMLVHYIKADIKKWTDAKPPLIAGFTVGLALGAICLLAPLLPILGESLKIAVTIYIWMNIGLFTLSFSSGIIKGLASGNWKRFKQAGQIFLGNFYLRKNRGFLAAFADGLSRHIWEFPQTLLGVTWAQVLNISGLVDRVDYAGGATFTSRETHPKRSGMSLGNFIYISIDDHINNGFRERLISDPLFMHEYGHSFDSRLFGLLYLPLIGLPSLISAAQAKQVLDEPKGVRAHNFKSYEMRANRHAAKYFREYSTVDWAKFETYYPLKKEGRMYV